MTLRTEVLMAATLGFLCLVLFFFRLGDRDLTSSHEARAGQDAQSMLNTGQWDLPRLFDGRVEMQKPPLYYWLVALCGWLNGGQVDGWCVRLPAALAALGCILLMHWWGIVRGRLLAGFLAALMLATALHFTTLARTGRIDMPLTFTVALALLAFVQGQQRRQRKGGRAGWRWFLAGYLAIAAGVMLKGPIAVVLPLAVAIGWWIYQYLTTGSRKVAGCDLQWGIPLVLVLTLPWYLWANWQTNGEWFRVFFWYHNVDRGLGIDDKLRAYPWWFYGPQLLLDFLPWSLLVPASLVYMWRRRTDTDARLGAVWLLAVLGLLSCMSFKRSDYLLPAFPGAAWMLGCALEAWYGQRRPRWAVLGLGSVAGTMVALWLAYILVVVPRVEATRSHRPFAEVVRRHTAGKVLFFRAEAHHVAFLVGPPLKSLLEWENLDIWAGKGESTYVILPPESLQEWPGQLKSGTLEVVARSEDLVPRANKVPWLPRWLQDLDGTALDNHERPLVLVRTRCLPKS
jgi:4-amino-4-deoxy-L-arabinose transferase-like glycosyltransferase